MTVFLISEKNSMRNTTEGKFNMKKYFNNAKLAVFAAFTAITAGLTSVLAFAEDAGELATEAPKAAKNAGFRAWIPILIYIAFFVLVGYFLIYRPGKKRKQEEEKLKSSLTLGDKIVTIGGICGTIVNIKDDVLTIESSIDRTLIEVKNWAVRETIKPISE